MDNDTKEFLIYEVEKNNDKMKPSNIFLALKITLIGIATLNTIIVISYNEYLAISTSHLISNTAAGVITGMLYKDFQEKPQLKNNNEAIRQLFAQHGLILEDEMAKSKGRSKC